MTQSLEEMTDDILKNMRDRAPLAALHEEYGRQMDDAMVLVRALILVVAGEDEVEITAEHLRLAKTQYNELSTVKTSDNTIKFKLLKKLNPSSP